MDSSNLLIMVSWYVTILIKYFVGLKYFTLNLLTKQQTSLCPRNCDIITGIMSN